jgi:hypothetical protein
MSGFHCTYATTAPAGAPELRDATQINRIVKVLPPGCPFMVNAHAEAPGSGGVLQGYNGYSGYKLGGQ